jgi:MarR family transcriptional regulator, organic hydroperoxide resistance regulator
MTASDSQADAHWQLGKLVDELHLQLTAHLRERATRVGLTVAQASALREMTGPMTMSELAGRMQCEPSNATVVIDKLEKLKLIERRPHPTDRRAKQLTLTADGAERRKNLLKILDDEPLLRGLTEQEQDELQNLLLRAISRR